MKNIFHFVCVSTLICCATTIFSCESKEVKFNKTSWNERIDGFYLNREEMVNDLVSNHLHKGMSYTELVETLGRPENYSDMETNTVAYGIMEDYGWNIDPVETKTLRIKLSKDSLVESYKIVHWKN